jgi:predicted CxxxxCH...CXXCH cytochrome family protein
MGERAATRRGRALSVGLAAAIGAALIAPEPGCLERRDEAGVPADEGRCASCHGDASRKGDFLQRAAPPRDLSGATEVGYPGVGAHAAHVQGSPSHAAVACSECHVVPDATDSPGHADDPAPAEIVFGPIATTGGLRPRYDALGRTCAESHCHGESDAVWTEPRASEAACGSCHGLPPAAPHPQSDRCETCHGAVVGADRHFLAPALHVDGVVEVSVGPCVHCHGSDQNAAPPSDTSGNTETSTIGVGAHQRHLGGGDSSRALACDECHDVPAAVDGAAHVDALPAEVFFSGVATTSGRDPRWDRAAERCSESWCHGPGPLASAGTSPPWVDATPLGCVSCHGAPPPAPHPQLTDCSRCHGDVIAGDDITITDRARHVDGITDVAFAGGCTDCHGDDNPAPPRDLAGATSTDSPGVGAHQAHLTGTARSRAVPCGECHLVPEATFAPGHLDTAAPAEVLFSGAATAFGAAPSYIGGSCQSTSCHGAVFPDGHASGGTLTTPDWTTVNGTQAACGTCHGLPPPAPHPKGDLNPVCSACHANIAPDNATFTHPELHVDGVVTFALP